MRSKRGASRFDADRVTTYKRVSGDAVEYEVFARKTRLEPLHQVGSVVAPDADLAVAYARATYDEERWIEMAIVRKDDIIELWQPGEP
jgi:1,2-phenylacetyl-CoA epoxidase PaaB subunit